MIITYCVDKYRVNRYQKAIIVLFIYLRLVHKNTPPNQNILFKANVTRRSRGEYNVSWGYITLYSLKAEVINCFSI